MSTNRTITTETGPAEVNPKTRRDARITVAENIPGFDEAKPGSIPPVYADKLADICAMLGIDTNADAVAAGDGSDVT